MLELLSHPDTRFLSAEAPDDDGTRCYSESYKGYVGRQLVSFGSDDKYERHADPADFVDRSHDTAAVVLLEAACIDVTAFCAPDAPDSTPADVPRPPLLAIP